MAKVCSPPEVEITVLQDFLGVAHNIDPGGSFGIVVPTGGTNEVVNPGARPYGNRAQSLNIVSGGGAGTLEHVTGISPYSYYAHYISLGGAALHQGSQLVPINNIVSYCFGLRAPCGEKFFIGMTQTGLLDPNYLGGQQEIVSTGCWQWICLCGTTQENDQVDLLVIPEKDDLPYYLSGYTLVQSPAGCRNQTYFDGDTFLDWQGLKEFPGTGRITVWDGVAQSAPSTINRFSRAAGDLQLFDDVDLEITSVNGLGMSEVRNITQQYAVLDGSYAQGQFFEETTVTFTGRLYGDDRKEIAEKRACLEAMVKPYHPKCREPMQLVYQCMDECGDRCGESLTFIGWYDGGLEGSWADITQEEVVMTFRTTLPFWQGDRQSYELLVLADNGTNPDANVVSANSVQRYAFCVGFGKKTATYAWPKFIFNGATGGGGYDLVEINNLDTGDSMEFDPPIRVTHIGGPNDGTLVVDTSPQNQSVAINPNSNNPTNLNGRLCGADLSWCFAPGFNNIEFVFENVVNPIWNTYNLPTGARPARVRVSWPSNYVSASEACECNDYDNCDRSQIQAGFIDTTLLGDSPINPPPNAP